MSFAAIIGVFVSIYLVGSCFADQGQVIDLKYRDKSCIVAALNDVQSTCEYGYPGYWGGTPETIYAVTRTDNQFVVYRKNMQPDTRLNGYHIYRWTGNDWVGSARIADFITRVPLFGLQASQVCSESTWENFFNDLNITVVGSDGSWPVCDMTPPPYPPLSLSATNLTYGRYEIRLSWTPSPDWSNNNGVVVDGYKIYYGKVDYGQNTANYPYTLNVTGGGSVEAIINNLEKETTYYFVIRAYNSEGEGDPSNQASAVTSGIIMDGDMIFSSLLGGSETDKTCPEVRDPDPDMVSNPINIAIGNKFESQKDLRIQTPNRNGFVYSRYYNSQAQRVLKFGQGWTNSYTLSITDEAVDLRRILDATGRSFYFERSATTGLWTGAFGEKTYIMEEDGGYTWYKPDGSKYHFYSPTSYDGKLEWIEDAVGNRQTVSYDSSGYIGSITDEASGRVITFHYNTNKLLEYISGPVTTAIPDGIWVTYGYDVNDNLTSVTYADGSGFTYEYDLPGTPNNQTTDDYWNLTRKLDKMGHELATWKYDSWDRAYASTTWDGRGVDIDYNSYSYGGFTGTVTVTDAYGVTRTYALRRVNKYSPKVTSIAGPGGCQSCAGEGPIRYAYDGQSNVIEKEYANGTIHKYSNFDAKGNPGTVILAFGTPEQRTVYYTYHPKTSATLTRKELSTLATSGNDIYKETIWDYDDDYNSTPNESPTLLVSRIIEKGYTKNSNGEVVVHLDQITVFQYNSKGQVTSVDGPLPGTQDYTSYAYDPVTGDLLSITPSLPQNVTVAFPQANYDAAGNPGAMVDINGQTTNFTFDGRNRLLTSTTNGVQNARSFNIAGKLESVTDSGNRTLTYTYDPTYGRLVNITDMDDNYLFYDYDAQGNPIENSVYDAANILQLWQGFDYQNPADPGKLWKIISHNDIGAGRYDTETVFEYDKETNTRTVIDERLNTTVYQYDPLNRLAQVNQPASRLTDYGYDSQGNPTAVVDATDKYTTYEYDDLGRVLSTVSPDTGTTTYTYDPTNNRVFVKRNDNTTVTYTYDALGRLTDIAFPDSAQDISLSYDEAEAAFGKGRLTGLTDPAGATSYDYNFLGQLEEERRTVNGTTTFTTGYGYDSLSGDLDTLTYPSGLIVSYQRDINGRISAILANGQPVIQNITYKPFGPVEDYVLGDNILTIDRTYNDRYLVKNIGAGAANYTYKYYDDGSVWKISGVIPPDTTTNGTTLSYAIPGTNKIDYSLGYGTQQYGYQDITEDTSFTFTYNDDSRLSGVQRSSASLNVSADYEYDGYGRRVKKTVGGVVTVYHYDTDNNLISETDEAGNPQRDYIYLGSEPVAMVVYGANAGTYYFINDHLGTPQQLVDGTGAVVWQAAYLPYGKAQVLVEDVVNNLRFPGQYYDEETGLHYNWHRYYDPATGRYLTPDPIGLEGGVNLYAYVQNNPVNFVDPWGLFPGDYDNPNNPFQIVDGVGGSIYRVPGSATTSGKPYIGRHNQPTPQRTRRSCDGRDRTQAEVVDTYNPNNPLEGRVKEQNAMNKEGGINNLDNKRNEIAERKWGQNGVEPSGGGGGGMVKPFNPFDLLM
jgi:RHS repeat-associated protein